MVPVYRSSSSGVVPIHRSSSSGVVPVHSSSSSGVVPVQRSSSSGVVQVHRSSSSASREVRIDVERGHQRHLQVQILVHFVFAIYFFSSFFGGVRPFFILRLPYFHCECCIRNTRNWHLPCRHCLQLRIF